MRVKINSSRPNSFETSSVRRRICKVTLDRDGTVYGGYQDNESEEIDIKCTDYQALRVHGIVRLLREVWIHNRLDFTPRHLLMPARFQWGLVISMQICKDLVILPSSSPFSLTHTLHVVSNTNLMG
ncbi:hypothetical protein XENOCAPTIV_000694 [Xenoophorus captivus]|uniref:Uncharacterized protein n=1 Tax=Xenoophorus captivus TaxID=1517983 RepID=A0ABV0QP51_9TELE